jgi:hypothetical protein
MRRTLLAKIRVQMRPLLHSGVITCQVIALTDVDTSVPPHAAKSYCVGL